MNQLQPHDWTFLSNHSRVLYCIAAWPNIRIRDIADQVRVTERAVQRIVVDLEQAGYLTRHRVGRQNHYRVESRLHLRHPLEHHVEVARLLAVLQPGTPARDLSISASSGPAKHRKGSTSRLKAQAAKRLKKPAARPRKKLANKPARAARST